MEKRCLIIDNVDQSSVIEKLRRDARAQGIDIECEQFNVGSTFDDALLTDGKIDIPKVVEEFRKRYGGRVFHLAAFDWDFSDSEIDGLELIRQFKHENLLKNTPKLLYTGLLEYKLGEKLDAFKNGLLTRPALLAQIRLLVNADIVDFIRRENYEDRIIIHFKTADESIDLILEDELSKFPDLTFKMGFGKAYLKNRRFGEVAQILSSNDLVKRQIKKEIIQEIISYLTEDL
jgi:hypothetical protein